MFSNPGKKVFLNFLKNSWRNNTDKFVKDEPDVWDVAVVSSNFKLSRFISSKEEETPTLYPVIPLKPRIHPVKVVEVIPVYEIISSSILSNPYSDGKPLVLGTVIVVSVSDISAEMVVTPTTTSGTKFSTFRYWSKLVIKSWAPPWNSWEM